MVHNGEAWIERQFKLSQACRFYKEIDVQCAAISYWRLHSTTTRRNIGVRKEYKGLMSLVKPPLGISLIDAVPHIAAAKRVYIMLKSDVLK
ncbi:hypothetical protein CDAR_467681 [Caerostris darwini]|uniref:Uncharacterized protein n=1 Tax=Caerostris darwini TaxID=1538125 RepID=A0AAV4SLU0_9ARAC|nr:hypothetical protein CDAR_467681 [Caerostris darwini]